MESTTSTTEYATGTSLNAGQYSIPPTKTRLEQLGFTQAASTLDEKKARARKMALAYELYRFVREEKIHEFNRALRAKGSLYDYQELDFCPIASYDKVPPGYVLDALEKAQKLTAGETKVFDAYEVAYIVNVKDPLLFARINGCTDRFFLAEWDNDVSIKDLLKDNEG